MEFDVPSFAGSNFLLVDDRFRCSMMLWEVGDGNKAAEVMGGKS